MEQEVGKQPERFAQPAWELVRRTAGSPRDLATKLRRLLETLHTFGREEQVRPRLVRLQRLGHIDVIPTRTQRMVGALDMTRFFIVPCAADYYDSKGINFRFHTVLRLLDDPASLIDPTGLNSSRDTIIGHVMQVVHANPHYDLQLLDTFEGGLDEMERQVEGVLAGTHPRTAAIQAIVEDEGYHPRLLEYIRAYRADPHASPPIRENVSKPIYAEIERTFGNLHAAMRYFARMPTSIPGAVHHLLTIDDFSQMRIPEAAE
ncbi:MAG: hypothetical protein AAF721_08850 [Myxococcota bacterium]